MTQGLGTKKVLCVSFNFFSQVNTNLERRPPPGPAPHIGKGEFSLALANVGSGPRGGGLQHMKKSRDRSRNIGLLLYPEWENYNDILTKLLPYPHAYITHDKDLKETEETEEEKKIHTHVYVQFENARSFPSIAKWLGIEERFVQGISNRNSYLRYLVHLDNPEKYQYSYDKLCICGLDEEFTKAFSLSSKLSTGYEFKQMYSYITESTKVLTYQDLSKYAIKEDIVTYLRQYYAILKDLLIEHNERISIHDKRDI